MANSTTDDRQISITRKPQTTGCGDSASSKATTKSTSLAKTSSLSNTSSCSQDDSCCAPAEPLRAFDFSILDSSAMMPSVKADVSSKPSRKTMIQQTQMFFVPLDLRPTKKVDEKGDADGVSSLSLLQPQLRCSRSAPSGCFQWSRSRRAHFGKNIGLRQSRKKAATAPTSEDSRPKRKHSVWLEEAAKHERICTRSNIVHTAPQPSEAVLEEEDEHAEVEQPSQSSVLSRVSTRPDFQWRSPYPISGSAGSDEDGIGGMTLKDYFENDNRTRTSSAWSQSTSTVGQTKARTASMAAVDDGSDSEPQREIEEDSEAAENEAKKNGIREALISAAGGPSEAFRAMDLSGHQVVSSSEFVDGLKRLGIRWQEITGLAKITDIFKLFDDDGNHTLSLDELFPDYYLYLAGETQRMSTPEFWNHWCKKTQQPVERLHSPKWTPANPDEMLKVICKASDHRQKVADDRRGMRSTIRRLKHQGMSDARCREFVASHLPRGTGPKDRDDIPTFSEADVRACRRMYAEKINANTRNIQKSVFDMREMRHSLKGTRHALMSLIEPNLRSLHDEHEKQGFDSLRLNFQGANKGAES